jgi:hypothetical protein
MCRFVCLLFALALVPCTINSETVYKFGEIPAHFYCRGKPVTFQIADGAGLSIEAVPQPKGRLSVTPLGGGWSFSYAPAAEDTFDFSVDFNLPQRAGRQSVVFTPKTVDPQARLVSSARPLPNPESTDYIAVSETPDPEPSFFNALQGRRTRSVEISGKTVVLDEGHPNNLYRFFGAQDISKLAIYAETVLVRSSVKLPQTSVTIYARRLAFETQTACIDTTPASVALQARQSENGVDGHDAGNITVSVEQLQGADLEGPARFVLQGGEGQKGGEGAPGEPGKKMRAGPADLPGYGRVQNVVYLTGFRVFKTDLPNFGEKAWPDGGDAKPPGRSGGGGKGGTVSISMHGDLDNSYTVAAVVTGGQPGDRASGQPGGEAGTPTSAAWAERVNNKWNVTTHTAKRGKFGYAPPVEPGADGSISVKPAGQASGIEWLHPNALRAMLDYAKDTYINGDLDEASRLLEELRSLVAMAEPRIGEASDEASHVSFEINDLLLRVAARRDYFGNPAGWVPMLSLAANIDLYKREIETAIRMEFLTHMVERTFQHRGTYLAALNETKKQLDESNRDLAARYNDAQRRIPLLQGELQVILRDTRDVEGKLEDRIRQLESQAKENLEESSFIGGLRVLSSVCKIFPIGQPVLGSLASGLDTLTNLSVKSPGRLFEGLDAIQRAFSDKNLGAAKKNMDDAVATAAGEDLPFKGRVKALADAGREWGRHLNELSEAVKGYEVPRDEVERELRRLEAKDKRYKELVERVAELNGRKEAFLRSLEEAMNLVNSLPGELSANLSAIHAIESTKGRTLSALDQQALIQIRDIQRRARERLMKYQYYMAKAYEYQMLEPYPGRFQTQRLLDRIIRVIEEDNGPGWLDSPGNFSSLAVLYEDDMAEQGRRVIEKAQTDAVSHTPPPIQFKLSVEQLESLNKTGQLRINLVEEGIFPMNAEDVRLQKISASSISTTVAGKPLNANVRLVFEHSGKYLIRSGRDIFAFVQHREGENARVCWGASYNAVSGGGTPHEDQFDPVAVDLLGKIIPNSSRRADLLFVRPAAWGDITITKEVTPANVSVNIDTLELSVTCSYKQAARDAPYAVLYVRTAGLPGAVVDCSPSDLSARTVGSGYFVRVFNKGENITLTAQAKYGDRQFVGWRVGDSQTLNKSMSLSLLLRDNMTVAAYYGEQPSANARAQDNEGGTSQ